MPRALLLALALPSLLCGCGPRRAERVIPPPLDPDAVTTAVMALADVDKDGLVKAPEFRNMPALAAALSGLDEDKDGGISRAELQKWLRFVKESEIAISQLTGIVMHRQKPLGNVLVTLVPEPCMGPDVATARAITDADGRFEAMIPGSTYPGVHCGFYRVEITGTGNDGKPLAVPQGAKSPLGLAVGGMLPQGGFATFTVDDASQK